MLDILLLILKIIGIILAVLLGLVILILLTVLFAPVKYNIRASYYDNKPTADVRVTALFHLVRFKLTYIEELKYRVKVLFFTVYSSDKKEKTETEARKKDKGSGKAGAGKSGKNQKNRKDSLEKSVFDEEEENVQDSMPESAEPSGSVEFDERTKLSESIEPAEGAGSAENDVLHGAENAAENDTLQEKAEKSPDFGNVTENATETDNGTENSAEADHEKNILKKLIRKIQEFVKRIKELYESLKEKLISIIDSIRNKKEDLSEKIDAFYEVINNEDNRELVRFLWEQLKKLLRIIKPKKGKLYVHYGMDDPETTGKIAIYLAVLYGWLGLDINILPDFEQKIMEGELQLKGSIRLFGIIVIALKVYTNKQFKKVVLKK